MKTVHGLRYSKTHEWLKISGKKAELGITDFAQNSLGDIVYVELPKAGSRIGKGAELGIVESVKAASDLYSPVSGVIAETNSFLEDSPESINADPYGSWLVRVELDDPDDAETLMDESEYISFCEEAG